MSFDPAVARQMLQEECRYGAVHGKPLKAYHGKVGTASYNALEVRKNHVFTLLE